MTSRFACRSLVLSLSAVLAFACSSGGESADDATNGQTAADDDVADDDASDDDVAADDDVADDDATSDDDVGPIDVPVPVPTGDDDVGDDDVGSGDDDAADDDVSDDDVTGDDDVADDDVVGDDDVNGDPPGVQCADYVPCSGLDDSGCTGDAWCIVVPGCETAICIESDDFCEQSCPDVDACFIGDSYPGSPDCEGLVSGTPAPLEPLECPGALPTSGATCNHASNDDCLYEGDNEVYSCMCTDEAWECFSDPLVDEGPPGVNCSDYPICDPQGAGCDAGDNCMSLGGCDLPICIPAEEACELSCPEPTECAILESYPEQLSCDGYVDAHGEQGEPDEGHLFSCGSVQCQSSTQYCFIQYSGVAPIQGEAIVAPAGSCNALPSECVGMASCECLGISADLAQGQQCSEMDGAVTVELFAP